MDHRYFYEGPVLEFDNVIAKCWRGGNYSIVETKSQK